MMASKKVANDSVAAGNSISDMAVLVNRKKYPVTLASKVSLFCLYSRSQTETGSCGDV